MDFRDRKITELFSNLHDFFKFCDGKRTQVEPSSEHHGGKSPQSKVQGMLPCQPGTPRVVPPARTSSAHLAKGSDPITRPSAAWPSSASFPPQNAEFNYGAAEFTRKYRQPENCRSESLSERNPQLRAPRAAREGQGTQPPPDIPPAAQRFALRPSPNYGSLELGCF